jgi:hypothetical protein
MQACNCLAVTDCKHHRSLLLTDFTMFAVYLNLSQAHVEFINN